MLTFELIKQKDMLKIIIAQFPSKCHASKKRLKKGDTIVYDVIRKVAYHPNHAPKQSYGDDGRVILN
jgi:hypothetical protein